MKVALLSFDAKEVEIQVSTNCAQTGSCYHPRKACKSDPESGSEGRT
jgi:hypothetical protein